MRIGRMIPPAAAPIYMREVISGIKGILHGKEEVERFRIELRKYFDVKHCFLVSSGKAALSLVLRALHDLHPDRDEVIIPAFACYSVPSAIVRAGLKIKLCEVDADTLDFDFNYFEQLLANKPSPARYSNSELHTIESNSRRATTLENTGNRRLLAIVSIHLFGLPANLGRIRELVRDPDVTVIEDAAQAMGGEHRGKKLGTIGDVGFFSLGRGKALSTIEGGIILTQRDSIAKQLKKHLDNTPCYPLLDLIELILKAFALVIFQHPSCFWLPKSLPFLRVGDTFFTSRFKIQKITPFQAGLAKNWRQKLKEFSRYRKHMSANWLQILRTAQIYTYADGDSGIPNFIRFPVRLNYEMQWARLLESSCKEGLGIMLTYPDAVSGITEFKHKFDPNKYPAARTLSRTLLTLPVHSYVMPSDQEKIFILFSRLDKKN